MREERDGLQSSIGLYAPTFLKMHINCYEPLDNFQSLSPRSAAAFLHEYIHFLQDITTTSGLRNTITIVDFMKSVNMVQRESTDRIMPIPYKLDENRQLGAHYNGPIQKLHAGTIERFNKGQVSGTTTRLETKSVGYKMVDIEIVELEVTSETGRKYHIGSHAVLESMAYTIENMVYPNEIEAPGDFCYTAVKELILFVYPALQEDPSFIVALCDATLMYYNSGAILYRTLLEMKAAHFVPKAVQDIYDFVHSRIEIEYGIMDNLHAIFNNHTLTAASMLSDYFTIDIFKENKAWIDYTLKSANLIRNSNWKFFIDLANGGPISENAMFSKLLNRIGMPMTTNAYNQAYFYTPISDNEKIMPQALWAVNQIFKIYVKPSSVRKCNMEDWCRACCKEQNIEDYTDYHCLEDPWNRYKNGGDLCTFSQVWRSWGMEAEIPIERPKSSVQFQYQS